MPEIVRLAQSITPTTAATAAKSDLIQKRRVILEAPSSNTAKIYVAISYERSAGQKTDFEPIQPGQAKFYSAPQQRHCDNKIFYVWLYADAASQTYNLIASDGALTRFPFTFTNGLYNPSSGLVEQQRTPSVSKAVSVANPSSETTIWTPATGKKFRLMMVVILKASNTATFTFRDGTGGTTILSIAGVVSTLIVLPLQGNGLLSAAANNVLTLQCPDTGQTTGTVFGTEE